MIPEQGEKMSEEDALLEVREHLQMYRNELPHMARPRKVKKFEGDDTKEESVKDYEQRMDRARRMREIVVPRLERAESALAELRELRRERDELLTHVVRHVCTYTDTLGGPGEEVSFSDEQLKAINLGPEPRPWPHPVRLLAESVHLALKHGKLTKTTSGEFRWAG